MSHEFHAEITFFDAVFQTFILSMLFFGVALLGLCCLDTYTAGPVSRWGAKLSYSTYLVHWPLVPSCLFLPAIFGIGSVYHSLDSALFFMVGLWTTSLILAFMIYTLIETPFLRFKSKKS
jgi:peptidoglycan/LPS O-acetylase OafA/YrhL